MNKEIKSSNKESKMILKIVAFVTFIIFLVLWVSHMATCDNAIKYNGLGEIGDTIGGLTAPIIGLLAAYLVYISFEEQRKANISNIDLLKLQREQFEEEKKRNLGNDWYNRHHVLLEDVKAYYKNIEFNDGDESNYGTNAFNRSCKQSSFFINQTFQNSVMYLLFIIEDLAERLALESEYTEEAELIKRKLNLLYYKIISSDVTRYKRHLNIINYRNRTEVLNAEISGIESLQHSINIKFR